MTKNGSAAKKTALLAALTALSLITYIIENQFPPMFVPGARMGLANAFSFAALIMFSPLEGFAVVVVRTALGAMFAGNLSQLLYSFTGGMVSMAVSSALMYALYPKISVMAVSICSAAVHNITQNLVFVLITDTPLTASYMPYLIILGCVSGAVVGGVILLVFKKIPENVFMKAIGKNR